MSNYLKVSKLTLNVPNTQKSNFKDIISFRNFNFKTNLLNNISFELSDGDIMGILGKNGAGKSTLLKCIAGIYENYSGEIQKIGKIAPMLELSAGFKADFNAIENINLIFTLINLKKPTINQINQILKFSGLLNKSSIPIKHFSSGMIVRLGFSIMSTIKSDILILDEVFSVGDRDFVIKSKERIMKKINSSKITLLTSHNEDLISTLCNKCLILDKGNQIYFGKTKKALSVYKNI